MFRRRVLVAAVALAGFGLVGCGSGDSVDADDPLVGAIVWGPIIASCLVRLGFGIR